MRSASTREKVGFLGALELKTGRLLTRRATTFNTQTFGEFLEYLLWHTKGKIHLILDNATWHRAEELKGFYVANAERLIRIFLPPYSSELNPIERVWRITRRQVTHNRYFQLLVELETSLINHFSKWEHPNETLRVLCANI